MKETQKGLSELQSKLDQSKEAMNADNGFKTNGNSALMRGVRDTKNKR